MRRLGLALFVCLAPITVHASTIVNCAGIPAFCALTPSASGNFSSIATDYRGYVDASYASGTVTSGSYTLYDANYGTTVTSAVTVGYDGIHGSSSMTPGGSGGGIGRFNGEIIDYFQLTGKVPAGAQLEVTYGADILSNASYANHSDYSATLSLNSTDCFNGYHYGNLTDSCTTYVAFNPNTGIAELDLNFFAELDGSQHTYAFLDASNTAKFQAITVVDSGGNPLPGAQLIDASGFNYNAAVPPAATTPEPSSLLLLATGFASLTGIVRRRLAKA